jgi:hypothetical protein
MSSDEGMRLMPRLDAFDEVSRHDLADDAAAKEAFDLGVERGVPKDVADDDPSAKAPSGSLDGEDVFESVGDGLFKEKVATEFHRADGVVSVLGILRADDDDIRWFAGREHRFRRSITAEVSRLGGFCPDELDPTLDGVGTGNECEAVRHLGGYPRVGPGTGSTTAEG